VSPRGALLAGCLAIAACAAADPFQARQRELAAGNPDFAEAVRLFQQFVKQEGTGQGEREGLQRVIDQLGKALQREPSNPHKSVIHVMLAATYLTPPLNDCDVAKRHSSAALHFDPASDQALELDVVSDFCVAGRVGDYSAAVHRLEELAARGKTVPSHDALLSQARSLAGDRWKRPGAP
jgi:hypothetical protein